MRLRLSATSSTDAATLRPRILEARNTGEISTLKGYLGVAGAAGLCILAAHSRCIFSISAAVIGLRFCQVIGPILSCPWLWPCGGCPTMCRPIRALHISGVGVGSGRSAFGGAA